MLYLDTFPIHVGKITSIVVVQTMSPYLGKHIVEISWIQLFFLYRRHNLTENQGIYYVILIQLGLWVMHKNL